jgi:hypothetical protein
MTQPPYNTSPLTPADPTRIGDFWLDARLVTSPSGVAYVAHEEGAAPVMVVLLSQGAADDAAARDRLAGQVDRMHIDTVVARGGLDQDRGRMGSKFRSEEDDPTSIDGVPQAPWVALAFDGSAAAVHEAERLLAEVDLAWLPQQGRPAGPEYRLHWIDRHAPGLTHVWPLPWPGRRDRAGKTTILAAFLLMLLLAAVAILIAILIFSQSPPTPPSPPTGEGSGTGSASGSGTASSSSSASSSESATSSSTSSASPSPSDSSSSDASQSSSPSPSDSESGSGSPSPSGSESGSASPTPSSSGTGSASPSPSLSPSPSSTGDVPGPTGAQRSPTPQAPI